ncbi:hypothetical protein GCM10027037_32130 [Mucilaginibacter koreensis]
MWITPANHFEQNNYQTREANFTGKVLYYSLSGQLLKGYRYREGLINGTITQAAGPAGGTALTPALKTEAVKPMLRDANGCETRAITTVTYTCVSAGDIAPTCTPNYTTTYYQVCDDGSGGGSGGPQPPAPGGGGGGGGSGPTFPPAPTGPDPNDNDPTDPCKQSKYVSAKAQNTTVKAQNDEIKGHISDSNVEYGANQNISQPNVNGVPVSTPVTTNGADDSWTPTPTWNNDKGYTVGFSHNHPDDNGPSPNDVFAIFSPLYNSEIRLASQADKDFYKSNASVTTLTSNGSYIVMIKDWNKMLDLYNTLYTTQAQKNAFKADYINIGQLYFDKNPTSGLGMAGVYALLKKFGDAINVYKADASSMTYQPFQIVNNNGIETVAPNPCPTNPLE